MKKNKMTVKQYADFKGVTTAAIYKSIREDRVKFEKIGTVYIILL